MFGHFTILCMKGLTAGDYRSASGQLQNNTVNGASLITINPVIII